MPRAPKPVSTKQLAANRANAIHSTGPSTPEGKARSAQNARKHGFTAATFAVVRLEDLHEVADLQSDLAAVYQPINAQELYAIERIALAQQSMLRASRLEAGLFTTCLNYSLDPSGEPFIPMAEELVGGDDIEITRAQNRNYALAEGFHRMAKAANTWSLALRYQAQSERLYRRAVEDLERLMALRPELPNEPISAGQPEPTEASYTPAQTNPLPPTPAPNRGADSLPVRSRDRFMSSARAAGRQTVINDSHLTRRPAPALVPSAPCARHPHGAMISCKPSQRWKRGGNGNGHPP